MEVNWSTFILEIINFLVLVWILKHFLYKPVLDVIAQRRSSIEQGIAEAKQTQSDAETLKRQYENRLADWDQERQQARELLNREIEQERVRQLEALEETLSQEREKSRTSQQKQYAETVREIEHHALEQASQFATRLLEQASGPELQTRLFEILIEGLDSLSKDQIAALKHRWGTAPQKIDVSSAFDLSDTQQQQLQDSLHNIIGKAIPTHYQRQGELISGLRICIGAWVLQANVKDELKGFSEFVHAAR